MTMINGLLAVGLLALPAAAARAEECSLASTDASGAPRISTVTFDLESPARLDPATLPERASAVMCLRRSIVPRPDDVRVLIEWRIAFGIAEHGPRQLWISVNAGTLQVQVDHGELRASERAALDRWREAAQLRYVLAVAAR